MPALAAPCAVARRSRTRRTVVRARPLRAPRRARLGHATPSALARSAEHPLHERSSRHEQTPETLRPRAHRLPELSPRPERTAVPRAPALLGFARPAFQCRRASASGPSSPARSASRPWTASGCSPRLFPSRAFPSTAPDRGFRPTALLLRASHALARRLPARGALESRVTAESACRLRLPALLRFATSRSLRTLAPDSVFSKIPFSKIPSREDVRMLASIPRPRRKRKDLSGGFSSQFSALHRVPTGSPPPVHETVHGPLHRPFVPARS